MQVHDYYEVRTDMIVARKQLKISLGSVVVQAIPSKVSNCDLKADGDDQYQRDMFHVSTSGPCPRIDIGLIVYLHKNSYNHVLLSSPPHDQFYATAPIFAV